MTTPSAKIEAVLSGLPVIEDRRSTIPTEAANLAIFDALMSVKDLPRARNSGSKKAVAEIRKLADLAARLGLHILDMHRDSLGALEKGKPRCSPLGLTGRLDRLIDGCAAALVEFDGVDSESPKGAPAKRRAAETARYASRVYKRLTGEAPTTITDVNTNKTRGPFFEYLRDLFAVLGIEASAATWAKAVIRQKKHPKKRL